MAMHSSSSLIEDKWDKWEVLGKRKLLPNTSALQRPSKRLKPEPENVCYIGPETRAQPFYEPPPSPDPHYFDVWFRSDPEPPSDMIFGEDFEVDSDYDEYGQLVTPRKASSFSFSDDAPTISIMEQPQTFSPSKLNVEEESVTTSDDAAVSMEDTVTPPPNELEGDRASGQLPPL